MKARISITSFHRDDRLSLVDEVGGDVAHASAMGDMELLSAALQEALQAKDNGEVIGPDVDEVTLRRAERRARRADSLREQNTLVLGGVA